ncbi:hypothetical protein [Methylomonas sp. CM2]|uniref:hypothetical protein n=1 Tax=Methylomonas sp. CM2 TaxID=3417647 RepID=UPI003CF35C3A
MNIVRPTVEAPTSLGFDELSPNEIPVINRAGLIVPSCSDDAVFDRRSPLTARYCGSLFVVDGVDFSVSNAVEGQNA